jgi:hypothetical protein
MDFDRTPGAREDDGGRESGRTRSRNSYRTITRHRKVWYREGSGANSGASTPEDCGLPARLSPGILPGDFCA